VVPEEALGAGIPTGDDRVLVDLEQRVFPDVVDEEAKALFALTECFFGIPAVREVAHDLGKPDGVAGIITQPCEDT
jgi:hypothetical protein